MSLHEDEIWRKLQPSPGRGGWRCLPPRGWGVLQSQTGRGKRSSTKGHGDPHSRQPTGQAGESSAQEPRGCRARRRCGTDRQTPEQPWSRAGAVRPVHRWGPVPRTVTQSWRETARDQTDQTRGRRDEGGRERPHGAPTRAWGDLWRGRGPQKQAGPGGRRGHRPWGPQRSQALGAAEVAGPEHW